MGFRITTGMVLNTYKYNLQNSMKNVSDARDMVLTQRNFNSYAEDPAAATKAFRLRRSYNRTVNQLSNATNCYNKFNTAWNNLGEIVTNLENPLAKVSSIRGTNGTAGESRSALAQVLRETADSIVCSLNAQLGDQFIFAGNDGMNVPFTWSEDGSTLYYRGVDVNAGQVPMPDPATAPNWLAQAKVAGQAAGTWTDTDEAWLQFYSGSADAKSPDLSTKPQWAKDMLNETPANDTEAEWMAYYKDRDDLIKLNSMSAEERYIDLGMGAKENAPNDPILGSYFNDALCGINFLGYGKDSTDGYGDPKNYAVLLKQLADVFDTWDEDTQSYNPALAEGTSAEGLSSEELAEKASRMIDKLKAGQEHFTEQWVDMDARSKFLQTTQSRLSVQKSNLNEEILNVEQVDLAEAITTFSWDMYCYNAALKIGNQLLSQSLIDYMS